MNQVYVFLIRNDVWIYILAGIGLVWYLSQFVRARRSLRKAVYGLEKERGHRQQQRAMIFSLFFAFVIVGVSYVNISIAPSLPVELLKPPTPTPDIFITPLSSPTPIGTAESTAQILAPTVTLAGIVEQPTENEGTPADPTEQPTPPADLSECQPDVAITSPPTGALVDGRFTVFGSAAGGDALDFDLEILGESTDGRWQSVFENRQPAPVLDGILGTVDLSESLDGIYTLRLTAYDSSSDIIAQCAIQVDFVSPG